MNEMQYQVDLMNAMNEKLQNEQKMMKMIIETSTSAVVYYSYDELRTAIEQFIKYYNERRIKSKLGWLSPVQYRLKYQAA